MVKETIKIISVEMIQKEVGDYYNISISELKAKKRNKNVLLPRQLAMHLTRQMTRLSYLKSVRRLAEKIIQRFTFL
jgi:chromosomal replication initiator protein